MPEIDLCENCNDTECGFRLVTITLTDPAGPAYGVVNFRRLLCESCASCISGLHFAEFTRRHETRPRTMELP